MSWQTNLNVHTFRFFMSISIYVVVEYYPMKKNIQRFTEKCNVNVKFAAAQITERGSQKNINKCCDYTPKSLPHIQCAMANDSSTLG